MERKNIFWGIFLLVGAVALLADKLGFIKGAGFWTIFWTALVITILVKSIMKRKFGCVLFAAAFLVIVNAKLLHLEAITPWPVLLAALLGTIGLKLLFPKLGSKAGHAPRITDSRFRPAGNGDSGAGEFVWDCEEIAFSNVFGENIKYVEGEVKNVKIDNVFGSMQIYFTNAVLKNGLAQVSVDNVFGSVIFYVPSSWRVMLNTENILGSAEEGGRNMPDGENELRISGSIVFGSFEVIYI